MNKKSILCTVLALSLVLIGTGYAYWTDTLNITTKATTGDMEVKFVDLGAYAQYNNEDKNGNWSIIDGIGEEGYVGSDFFGYNKDYNDVFGEGRDEYYERAVGFNSVTFDAEIDGEALTKNYPALPYGTGTIAGDTINITLDTLYPGYAQAFRTDIINIGSIAVKLAKVDFALEGSSEGAEDLIGVALLVQDEEPIIYEDILKLASNFDDDEKFTLGGVDFVRLSALASLTDEEMIEIANNLILVPNTVGSEEDGAKQHRADLYIGVAVDPDEDGLYTTGNAHNINEENNDADTQNQSVELDIKFAWDQFNMGNNPETTNILEKQN